MVLENTERNAQAYSAPISMTPMSTYDGMGIRHISALLTVTLGCSVQALPPRLVIQCIHGR